MNAASPVRPRDPRLDFFRGLAMFIIVIAHTPSNPWTLWIPARFGFSDATEIFVFCSGMASAIAFGGTFAARGWWIGAARILFRTWQVYWFHVATFFVIAALMVFLNRLDLGSDYVSGLNLQHFFADPVTNIPALLTLTYVPNYFDILPMYLAILAMVPLAVLLARIHPGLVAAFSLAMWLAANRGHLDLPAEPWSDRSWFFNPFGWQLLFFTGFALMAGWLPAPPVRRELALVAGAFVLLTVPLAHWPTLNAVPALREAADSIRFLTAKTPFGLLRYVHFLALAYLAWIAVGPRGARLDEGTWWPRLVTVIRKVGQQSLPVFVAGLVLSRLLGVLFDLIGRTPLTALLVNALGMVLVVVIAHVAGWFKSQPWRRPAAARPQSAPAREPESHLPRARVQLP